jgi:hypothetical protein
MGILRQPKPPPSQLLAQVSYFLGLLGLRLFTVYHPGDRVAATREGYRSVCGCLGVRWQRGACVRKILTRQSITDKLPALKNRVNSS